MKRNKIIYLVSTGLLTLMMLFSAGMYLFKHEEVKEMFGLLGFPSFIIYPLAIAKLLGLVAIWTRKSASLKEWAYAGFFFDFLLALGAHLTAGDGDFGGAAAAIVLLFVSYFTEKKLANLAT